MGVMQPLPVPCPARLIPDATGTEGFHKAYRQAMEQKCVFVAVEHEDGHWTVKADTLTTGSDHAVEDSVDDAIRAAITRLVHNREAGPDSYAGPVYFMMHGVPGEQRARELAAALQAALYGDPEPLIRAVPTAR